MTTREPQSPAATRPKDDGREVIVVDHTDRSIGAMPKLDAHEAPGFLHRAFSIFVFDPSGRVLLQRRALTKYHFAGRWTNTCCSHPEPNQTTLDAAHLRLDHEMGLLNLNLVDVGSFHYSALDVHSGLVENELDHVLIGTTTAQPDPNPAECADHRWITPNDLHQLIDQHPTTVTPWLRPALHLASTATSRCTT